jgi:hypothetical protein
MRIKVEEVGKGLHPSEAIVRIDALGGPQELVVDRRTIRGGSIEVGHPVAKNEGYFLVELPAETSSGTWRVWVDESTLAPEALEAAE